MQYGKEIEKGRKKHLLNDNYYYIIIKNIMGQKKGDLQ